MLGLLHQNNLGQMTQTLFIGDALMTPLYPSVLAFHNLNALPTT